MRKLHQVNMDTGYKERSLGELILKGLRMFPPNINFQINGETGKEQTARDVLVRSVQVASGLRKLGVKVEDVVAILSLFSENCIAAIFGALIQGAAPFPLEHNLKQREMEYMFNLCRPKIIFLNSDRLMDARKALVAIGHQAPIFVLNGEGGGGRGFDQVLDVDVDVVKFESSKIDRPDQRVAAVIHSSGTTGLPKAVAATHAAYQCQIDEWRNYVTTSSRFLALTPPYWVTGFLFLIKSVVLGYCRIYLVTASTESILRAIGKYKPTWTLMAPITLAHILEHPDLHKYEMASLNNNILAGSSAPQSTIQLCKDKLPQMTICQRYGATEVCGAITESFDPKYVYSTGTFMSAYEWKIVDGAEKRVGANVDGEIRLRTPALFKCYMGDEQATRDAFDEDGFYRTGDVGRVDEDQYLYITGRVKELFEVRQNQVSPAELEDVIRGLAGVTDVAVVGIPHEIDQNHPRALVVKQPGSSITLHQIVDEVADKLSDPKHLLGGAQFVDAIPRSTTGKLIRRDLPKLVVLPS